ncbi:hypothetical protein MGWOODY_Mmi1523 [hydrothermal vent metagenome]|uniref:Uncharacterized protein n=1 Tax=hydrothermal vent metagenome TaxID=652676 RepID=A0A160VIP8_9ZZZZ
MTNDLHLHFQLTRWVSKGMEPLQIIPQWAEIQSHSGWMKIRIMCLTHAGG